MCEHVGNAPPPPPPSLPVATGIPVTPRPNLTRAAQTALPTATVAAQPTPENAADMFADAGARLKEYQPPETDPQPLYSALARGIGEFLAATANGDVSMEGQPALAQLQDALLQIPNLPPNAKVQAVAIHTGDDQGGSRDVMLVSLQGVMGLPVIGLERLGATYEPLSAVAFNSIATADSRNFYAGPVEAREVTGDEIKELIYTLEFVGASGTTNDVTVARWIQDENKLRPIFHASLVNWAGESDYQIETTADASSIKITFPWFGAFDHKLLAHPTATQTWEYDDQQDAFVRVSQSIEAAKTPRQQLNAAEYLFRNGDLGGAVNAYERVWNDPALQPEDFGDSKADPLAFAKFRRAMLLGILGRDADAKKLLNEVNQSGNALAQIAQVYAKNSSGKDGALRGWIAMANAGDLYELIYEAKAGNLDFPFEAGEIYLVGGVVAAYLNTHGDMEKDPDALWRPLQSFGFKTASRVSADLDGNGVNEFLFVTEEGGNSPNQAQQLWFVYNHDKAWRVRALDLADTLQLEGDTIELENGSARAVKYKLPEAYTPNMAALTWNGARLLWLDATTLKPIENAQWTTVGGGVLEDDF
ncbi:MAG: hypothetical protein HY741_24935 [Chloroflexi bacterium]|nr:hypothetical protein [Chloroflexota bacterium]